MSSHNKKSDYNCSRKCLTDYNSHGGSCSPRFYDNLSHQSSPAVSISPQPPTSLPSLKTVINEVTNDPEDCNTKEQVLIRELDEVRARAAQMEKTMRWWSDCTSNWRDKWSKVRSERNKARDDIRQYKSKLDSIHKECSTLKREKQDLVHEVEKLQCELQEYRCANVKQVKTTCLNNVEKHDVSVQCTLHEMYIDNFNMTSGISLACEVPVSLNSAVQRKGETIDVLSTKDALVALPANGNSADKFAEKTEVPSMCCAQDCYENPYSSSNVEPKIQEMSELSKNLLNSESELIKMDAKYEKPLEDKTFLMNELSLSREKHKDMVRKYETTSEDEDVSKLDMSSKLTDLRKEFENLQSKNANEWQIRERLESEKLSLERENKNLRNQIVDLEEEIEKKSKQLATSQETNVKTLELEITEKIKELSNVKHSYAKLKKLFNETSTELEFANRRAEQHESEVNTLRTRIDELKVSLISAEDEVDSQGATIRKLQRANDDFQSESESLHLQLNHLQTRLKQTADQCKLEQSQSSSLQSFELDSPVASCEEDDNLKKSSS